MASTVVILTNQQLDRENLNNDGESSYSCIYSNSHELIYFTCKVIEGRKVEVTQLTESFDKIQTDYKIIIYYIVLYTLQRHSLNYLN